MDYRELCLGAGVPLWNGKYKIPEGIKRVKLDVGLSYNAPFTTKWLTRESDLLVFGFEPHPETYQFLKIKDRMKFHPVYGNFFPPIPFVDTRLYLFPIALSDVSGILMDFYKMNQDVGVSSLYKPSAEFFEKNPSYAVQSISKVPVYTLQDFFDLFPFDNIPYIEYIKIDAQGSDLNIAKGAGKYLQERVVYITLEPDGHQYEGASSCNKESIREYMHSIGFIEIEHPNVCDPTYVNTKYMDIASSIWIMQQNT